MNEKELLTKVFNDLQKENPRTIEDFIKTIQRSLNRYLFYPKEKVNNNQPVVYLHMPLTHFLERFKQRKVNPSKLIKTLYYGYLKHLPEIEKLVREKSTKKVKFIFEFDGMTVPVTTDYFLHCVYPHPKNEYMCITSMNKEFPRLRLVAKTVFEKGK